MAPVEMMPFSCLWFSDPAKEVLFGRHHAVRHFEPRDLLFRLIRACIIPAFIVIRLWQHGLGRHGRVTLLNVAVSVGAEFIGFGWQRDKGGRKRTAMAAITRIVIIATQALDATTVDIVVKGPWSLIRFMFLQTGMLALCLCNMGVPLLLKHNLLVHGAAAVAMSLSTAPNMCAVALSGPESAPIVLAVWRFVNAVFLGSFFTEKYEITPEDACWSTVAMTYFVFGLLVPSYAMWVVEYESRINFIERGEVLTEGIMRKQMLLFVPIMGCVWLLLNIKTWV